MILMEYILWHSLMSLIIMLRFKRMRSYNHFNKSVLVEVTILHISSYVYLYILEFIL